jgi:hypothetical protein
MKNIHILPTDQPSRLHLGNSGLVLCDLNFGENTINGQHIYITSDEEIKEDVNQWYLDKFLNKPMNSGGAQYGEKQNVIILTTDPTLIADGVQAIDDEFLEWFVKNPTCEFVDVKKQMFCEYCGEVYCGNFRCRNYDGLPYYEIIIPQEEPKQETLEEAAKKYKDLKLPDDLYDGFIAGANYMAERRYSEEEVLDLLYKRDLYMLNRDETQELELPTDWFKEFKKK